MGLMCEIVHLDQCLGGAIAGEGESDQDVFRCWEGGNRGAELLFWCVGGVELEADCRDARDGSAGCGGGGEGDGGGGEEGDKEGGCPACAEDEDGELSHCCGEVVRIC